MLTFKVKYNAIDEIEKQKVSLLSKSFFQKHGKDFDEIFTAIALYATITAFLAAATHNKLKSH